MQGQSMRTNDFQPIFLLACIKFVLNECDPRQSHSKAFISFHSDVTVCHVSNYSTISIGLYSIFV